MVWPGLERGRTAKSISPLPQTLISGIETLVTLEAILTYTVSGNILSSPPFLTYQIRTYTSRPSSSPTSSKKYPFWVILGHFD